MDAEADLAALALTRLAIEHRDHPGGNVMETIKPYLQRYWEAAENRREDGSVDIAPAIVKLLACLSQWAGAAIEALVTEKSGGVRPTKEQLFDRLRQFQLGLLTEGGGDHGGTEAGG